MKNIHQIELAGWRKTYSLKFCSRLAILALLVTPAWAERLDPVRSVAGEGEDLKVNIYYPNATTGDLYIAADVNGVLFFLTEHGWLPQPLPREYAQTFIGTKQIDLGNTSGIAPGIYKLYQVTVTTNAPDVYDSRNWIGGLNALGQTNFQVRLGKDISGDFNGDGFADDDANRDGFHDDDLNRTGFHADDANHDGYHDDDANRDGFHDDDLSHTGYHPDDSNHDGFHDDDIQHTGFHPDDLNHDGQRDGLNDSAGHEAGDKLGHQSGKND